MSPQFIAIIIDLAIGVAGGVLATLYGFRVIGPKAGVSSKFDATYSKWLRHLKWLGPICILFSVLQAALALYSRSQ